MPKYMVLFKANPSAWPSDPKRILSIWEASIGGGDQLLKMGSLKEVGWFSPHEGYAIFETDSKEKLLGMVSPFFPYFSQEIHEITPWEKGKEALLSSARRVAASV